MGREGQKWAKKWGVFVRREAYAHWGPPLWTHMTYLLDLVVRFRPDLVRRPDWMSAALAAAAV